MSEFVVGQRWVVDTEPELGLGIVVEVDARSVCLFFAKAECERRYAIQNAPLTRIRFEVDDEIHTADGLSHRVIEVLEQDGLLFYQVGARNPIVETSLSPEIRLNQPLMRMLMGQLDQPRWFYFRRFLDSAMTQRWQSDMLGLLGVRANLIAHQIYIAWTACRLDKVRVLLADEVGLGKTIEAGMILKRLIQQERVGRALIVVPDALQVQWLVELVRKFSLTPDLFAGAEHDFHSGQIHILPQSALESESVRVLDGEFDLAIVDEAHHLDPKSQAFECLQTLSENCKHLILLTATPEQLGVHNHFARLQLLDSAKFSDFEKFKEEEEKFSELNLLISQMPKTRAELQSRFDLDDDIDDAELLDLVLDIHGVGRAMFRNVRSAISGFPKRCVVAHDLGNEPVFDWLASFLKSDPDRKVLVIGHLKETVQDCESYLWDKHGIDAAMFHEGQDLIERDRAAAYFADMEKGAQVLLCSEIGSEGRNFQFCHHLVCLDLPDNPDLLEQRIGRLDRIGQNHDVKIHIPFQPESNEATLFYWYHTVLNCIEKLNPAASKVHQLFWEEFQRNNKIEEEAKSTVVALEKKIEEGRDALLERNSCKQPQANQLIESIQKLDSRVLVTLVEQASELLQFHFEQLSKTIYSLIPSDKMLVPALPGIPPEGGEVTFDRETACQREDLLFLNWDSPFITGLWELLHHSEIGTASVATLTSKQLPAGHCLLECCFDWIIQSPQANACLPYLAEKSLRVLLLDIGDKNLASVMKEEALQESLQPVPKKLAIQIVRARKDEIAKWFHKADELAHEELKQFKNLAQEKIESHFKHEATRIQRLSVVNSGVYDEETKALQAQRDSLLCALNESSILQLSALRLIVITPPK